MSTFIKIPLKRSCFLRTLKNMSDEWSNFVNDTRTTCKYGAKCYQKNPDHLKTYKHPPQKCEKKTKKYKYRKQPYEITKRPFHKIMESKETESTSKQSSTVNPQMMDAKNEPQKVDAEIEPQKVDAEIEPQKVDVKEQDGGINTQPNHQEKHSSKDSPIIALEENTQFYNKTDDNMIYKELFLVEMPEDFFQFYKCLSEEKSIEQTLNSVNLQLIGPFDLLLGKLPKIENKDLYLMHWRFYYDPPEFQAILKKKGKSEYHIGYFRDDPCSKPEFLASNDSAKDYYIQPLSENIFGAVYSYLQNEKKSSPFLSMPCQKLMEKIKNWANEYNYSLDGYNTKKRSPVAKTLHGAGIVVPFDKKTELGYRPLVESNANLKKMFATLESSTSQSEKDEVLSQIQPVITYASIAVDECDFGTGLEIGIDLFSSGLKELEANAAASLVSAYSLLNRDAFSKIIQVHLKHRRKGPDMSIFK